MKRLLPTAALVLAGLAAEAQQVYRCGNTFSQAPCSADAQPTRVVPANTPDKPAGLSGFELCAATAKGAVQSPEPESARVAPFGERRTEVISYAGKDVAARRFDLTVDAKTQFGVYSGPVAYSCWLSEDQARVLQFGPRRAR